MAKDSLDLLRALGALALGFLIRPIRLRIELVLRLVTYETVEQTAGRDLLLLGQFGIIVTRQMALQIGLDKMAENGAARKSLIFTESRKTQTYLRDFLEANGHAGKVALHSGNGAGIKRGVVHDENLHKRRLANGSSSR